MKRSVLALLLASLFLVTAGCGGQAGGSGTGSGTSASAGKSTASESGSASSGSTSAPAGSGAASSNDVSSSAGSGSSTSGSEAPASSATGSRVLVACFSCTGNTEGIAQHIVSTLNADYFEIVPEEPYTDEDLNYSNSDSRSTKEQNDDSARPALAGTVGNLEDYDVIFLGYPIWWGQAPRIINTFLEVQDFSGKTIVPFCTSGSSPIGSSATDLHSLCDATWLDGRRFSAGASQDEVAEWIDGLDLNL